MKLTLLSLDEERVLQKSLQNGLHMVNVFLMGLGEVKDIVQVPHSGSACL